MSGFATCILAGIVTVLALDLIAPPVGLGLAVASLPAIENQSTAQTVVRSNKSDRLPVMTNKNNSQKSPRLLVGCDPVFSPLSASAHANYPARCAA